MSNQLTRLSNAEWTKVQDRVTPRFLKEVIGDKPTVDSTKDSLPDTNGINGVLWSAVIMLVFLMIFTGFKAMFPAIDFASSFYAGVDMPDWLGYPFKGATVTVFVLMATSGLIFFKLQSEDETILKKQKENPVFVKGWRGLLNPLRIEVWSPRLYPFLMYATIAWLFTISSHGNGTWFELYLPVILEVALAGLVAHIIENRRERSAEVHEVWGLRLVEWETLYDNRHNNSKFLSIMFQELRQALLDLERTIAVDGKRGKRKTKVNQWLELASGEVVLKVVTSEHMRLTSGLGFAKAVLDLRKDRLTVTTDFVEAEAQLAEVLTAKTTLRVPPNNARVWTVDTLVADFKARGMTNNKPYTEKHLREDYAPKYAARSAFRRGAKLHFN